jgi:lipopolysaccharide export system protein LptC
MGIVLALALALATASAWVSIVFTRYVARDLQAQREEPDYIVDDFRHYRIRQTGEPIYEITGRKLTHYPRNDTYLINFPVMESVTRKGIAQTLYSDWAYLEDENSKVHLHENVVLIRPPTPKNDTLRMLTDYLLLFPDEDRMQTDRKVVAYQGEQTLSGVGMDSNTATRELSLHSQVKAVYPPPKKRTNR